MLELILALLFILTVALPPVATILFLGGKCNDYR
jgi:hypothetical protein